MLFTTLVLSIISDVFSEFEKMLLIDKVKLAVTMAYYNTDQVIVRTRVETGGEHFNAALNRMNALKQPILICMFYKICT